MYERGRTDGHENTGLHLTEKRPGTNTKSVLIFDNCDNLLSHMPYMIVGQVACLGKDTFSHDTS